MEKITYCKMWTRDGKMNTETVSVPLEQLAKDAYQYGLTMASEVISLWDTVGRGMKKYRYFLVSKDYAIYSC